MADDDAKAQAAMGEARWLTTYGDAMTLLLTFFVLLFAMSTIDEETFQIVISSFQGAVGIMERGRTLSPAEMLEMGVDIEDLAEEDVITEEQVPVELAEQLQADEEEMVEIEHRERGLVIQVTDRLLFDSGQADLLPEGVEFLHRVAVLLNAPDYRDRQIRVEGHTDDVPPTRFTSNWELSVLRAKNVVEAFVDEVEITPERLSAVGFGETRPVAPNETEEGRAENRRVSIVLLRDDLDS